MFGDKTKLIQELNEFTAVNTFCFLLLQIDSEDKTQRKSMEEYYNYLRECIHAERVLQILDNNWMRWIGSLPVEQPNLRGDKQ